MADLQIAGFLEHTTVHHVGIQARAERAIVLIDVIVLLGSRSRRRHASLVLGVRIRPANAVIDASQTQTGIDPVIFDHFHRVDLLFAFLGSHLGRPFGGLRRGLVGVGSGQFSDGFCLFQFDVLAFVKLDGLDVFWLGFQERGASSGKNGLASLPR